MATINVWSKLTQSCTQSWKSSAIVVFVITDNPYMASVYKVIFVIWKVFIAMVRDYDATSMDISVNFHTLYECH